jgi:hypothetical protein
MAPPDHKLRDHPVQRRPAFHWRETGFAKQQGSPAMAFLLRAGRPERVFEQVVTPWHQCNNYYF